MKIHIIATRLEKTRILPRLANMLAENANYSISETPDETADLNYFFPYLELDNHRDFDKTPIAAWFTHLDETQKKKVAIWNEVAKRCDIRLTSAKIYYDMLKQYGPTYIVRPPLERNKFTIKK